MIELADCITVGYASTGGKLEKLLMASNKSIEKVA